MLIGQRTQPNQNPPPRTDTTDKKPEICQKKWRNLLATDLVFPHPNFLDCLVENMGFRLVDGFYGLVGKQVDMGWIAVRAAEARGVLFFHLRVGHGGMNIENNI